MTTNTATPNTPASANFEKLKAKLRELFELDKADLDFGIYRVLRARHQEIGEFLDKYLEKTVREALQSHGNLHQMQLGNDLRKAEQSAKDAGIAPEQEAALKAAPEKAHDQYLLGYFLDVESAGSASLLDLDQFRDPFAYQLKIAASSAGETVDTTIDLVETFNWLLGLKVKHIDAQKGFLTVTGERRAGGRTLVIWRTLSDDPIADNQALEAFLSKLAINPADTVFDYIYVNGSHTLTDPHNKVHLIEETFQRLMFDGGNFESLE